MDGINKRNLYKTNILCKIDFDARQLEHMVQHITRKYRDTQFEISKARIRIQISGTKH